MKVVDLQSLEDIIPTKMDHLPQVELALSLDGLGLKRAQILERTMIGIAYYLCRQPYHQQQPVNSRKQAQRVSEDQSSW